MKSKQLRSYILSFAILLATALPMFGYADSTDPTGKPTWASVTINHTSATYPDVGNMLESLQSNMPSLNELVSGFAYIAGIFFVFNALYKLRQYGEARTMMSNNSDLRGPLASLAVGGMLLFLPTTVDTLLITFYGTNEITQYTVENPDWQEAFKTIIMIVQFVGIVAIVRGLLYLNRAGSGHGSGQNFMGRGVTHLVAGVIGLNIIQAKDILYATLGLN